MEVEQEKSAVGEDNIHASTCLCARVDEIVAENHFL